MGTYLRTRHFIYLAFTFSILASVSISERPKPNQRSLVFWDVGQGDFATYIDRNNCWAFDVGGSKPIPTLAFKTLRESCNNREISVALSHFDLDHIRNFKALAQMMRIKQVIVSHTSPKSQFGKKLLTWIIKEKIPLHLNSDFKSLKFLWPNTHSSLPHKENDRSLVIHFARTLFTGDLSDKIEKHLTLPHVKNLKVGHHGSRTSTSNFLLSQARPLHCIVSSGKNSYGHPNIDALRRMSQAHCAILRTDKLGNIFIILD